VSGDRTSRAGGSRESRDPRIGTLIGGKYLVLERIGAGGMGRVYRAEQRPLGRTVALKIVAVSRTAVSAGADGSTGSEGDVVEKRFFREASILARLSHPNVVTVYDFGKIDPETDDPEADRHYYMAMELVSGQSLEARLLSRGAIPWQETVRIVRQIARGLHEAHAQGVVHRDLKPANVMLTRARDGSEIVKLLDFGIGKILGHGAEEQPDEPALTMEGIFVGSPGYVSPEQVMTGVVDARSDIYSLGVLTYRCLAGQSPFPEHRTAMALMTAHVHETPRSLRASAAGVPTWLAGLVHRCLEKSPDRRPQSVEDILAELGEHPTGQMALDRAKLHDPGAPTLDDFDSPGRLGLDSAPEPATVADRSVSISGPRSIPAPPRRRRAWLWIAPLAILLVGGGLIALLRLSERPSSTIPASGPAAAQSGDRVRAKPSVAASATSSASASEAASATEPVTAVASASASASAKPTQAPAVAIATKATAATPTASAAASKKPPTTTAPPPVDIQLSR
jgi:serine/threonine-protein kinase